MAKVMTALWPLCLALSLADIGDLALRCDDHQLPRGTERRPAPKPRHQHRRHSPLGQHLLGGTNYVQCYGGEWKSPLLGQGASFAVAFTNPGFYAYRTSESAQTGLTSGTVTVSGWTNQPPPVTINTPIDGFRFAVPWTASVQASVTNPAETVLVQYVANASPIGSATNPPYVVQWQPSTPGAYALVARATDRQGAVTESLPVNVQVLPLGQYVWGPRVLPTGAFLFFYDLAGGIRSLVYVSDNLSFANAGFVGTTIRAAFGMFVDESAPASGGGPRYYTIAGGR